MKSIFNNKRTNYPTVLLCKIKYTVLIHEMFFLPVEIVIFEIKADK